MKKKYIISMMLVLVIGISLFSSCFATVDTVTPPTGTKTVDMAKFEKAASNIWGVVRTVLQVAAFTSFIWVGIKYMFASADQKGELKKSFSVVTIGALITFGSTIIVQIILKVFTDITGK